MILSATVLWFNAVLKYMLKKKKKTNQNTTTFWHSKNLYLKTLQI